MKKPILLLTVLLAAVSCHESSKPVRDTIPFVKQIAEDTTGIFSLVRQYRTSGTKGSIAIIGEPEDCLILVREFLSSDRVDNIDSSPRQDRLPDFAGETFDVLMDRYNEPYRRMADAAPDSLREAAVRLALMAVDSVAYSNAFDTDNRLMKSRSKMLVLSSTVLAAYGQFDIDTLFKMAGREPLILSQADASLTAVQGLSHVAVWAPQESEDAYLNAAHRLCPGTDVVVLTPQAADARTAFRELLRQYRERRPDTTLDALVLDSFTMDLTALRAEQEHIYRKITEEDMAFDRMLSPSFRFVDPRESLPSACYRLLRRQNLFTHNISYPSARYFLTEEGPDGYCIPVEIGDAYLQSADFHVPNFD